LFLYFIFCHSFAYANIKVGAVFFEPPFVFSYKQGFSIDLVNTVCQGMQEQCDIVSMDFNLLFTALESGTIDVAVGIYIDDLRKQRYIFSLPYMLSSAQFITLKKNNINSLSQLKGTTVGIVKEEENSGILYNYLKAQADFQFNISLFDDMEDTINALNNNAITSAFLHESTVQYWITNDDGIFQTIDKPVSIGDGIGFMAMPANADLIQRINQQLQAMENTNAYINLYKTYFNQ